MMEQRELNENEVIQMLLEAFDLKCYTFSFKEVMEHEWKVSFSNPTKKQPVSRTIVHMRASILTMPHRNSRNIAVIEIQFMNEKMTRNFELKFNEKLELTNTSELKSVFHEEWIQSLARLQERFHMQ